MHITLMEQMAMQGVQKWQGEITYLLKGKASSLVSTWEVLLRKVSEKKELRKGKQVTEIESKMLEVIIHKKREYSNHFQHTMSEVSVIS